MIEKRKLYFYDEEDEETMELRTLRYFLAITEEKNITKAADALYITQPTLSRQMIELEEELGKKLFIRGKRKIFLTEDGIYLRKRAEEILALVEKTESAFHAPAEELSGEIYIGSGETYAMRLIAHVAHALHQKNPQVTFHLFSGNAQDVMEKIDSGLVNFGIFIEPADLVKYDFIRLPIKDTWGVLMRKDSPLAQKEHIQAKDLLGVPLLLSNQATVKNEISGWIGSSKLNIIATYNLLYNASLMVEEGIGCALCIDKIANTSEESSLCFRPLAPKLEVGLTLAWKKYQAFSKAEEKFLEYLKKEIHAG